MVRAIPPGGNWKNIPLSIPSKRLEQIRESFRRGEGSRSTYYGRLRPDAPSYTINTYFTRPGNGCHIHYAQDRVMSHREAARFQSFPDEFRFVGSQADVATQIGNAVPPLLAYQVASQFGQPGCFVDLFAGAGGLSLGFTWAGWKPLVANDVKARFLETYAANVHPRTVTGDIREAAVRERVLQLARDARIAGEPFLVLGGPPCQGFSTAGNSRSRHDERNHLFMDYRTIVEELEPDAFVFENVSGLLNMEGGRVFAEIRSILAETVDRLDPWILRAEEFGVPQRRTRVMLVGQRHGHFVSPPRPVAAYPEAEAEKLGRPLAITAQAAIGDLPAIEMGDDGQGLPYASEPRTSYQRLMRGLLSPQQFVSELRAMQTTPVLGQLEFDAA